jgi:hypothetical protein
MNPNQSPVASGRSRKTLTFAVVEPRKPPHVIEVDLERLLLGSGAHCDIRLPPESAAYEHVTIVLEGDAIVARVVARDAIAFFDGEARRESPLVAGSSIRIEAVEVILRDVRESEKVERRASPIRPIATAVAVLALLAGVGVLRSASAGGTRSAPPMPSPFSAAPLTCPEKQGALPLARQKLALARSKKERFRFYPRDGVEAVTLYRTATACFDAGSDEANAKTALAESSALALRIEDDLHSSNVSLERAIVRKDGRTALVQVKFQRELLAVEAEADPYVFWLALLESKLEASVSKE